MRSVAEARMLVDCGVDWVGIPLRLAVHTPDVSEAEAAEICRSIEKPHEPVLITYECDPEAIDSLARHLGASIVQLHGPVTVGQLRDLRARRSDLYIIKSLIVKPGNSGELRALAESTGRLVDCFLTDTFDPDTGAEGATGKPHDWDVSRALVRASGDKPVILAGGLGPDNVADAIRAVRPAGVDAHSRVEDSTGAKSRAKVSEFVARAKAAFSEVAGQPGPADPAGQ